MTVSLARAGRRPLSFGWPVRIGGWGGVDEYGDWVEREGFTGVIDATHPFANNIANRAALTSSELGIDHIRFIRPAWVPTDRDTWTFLNHEAEAANHIPTDKTVFIGTGRRNLCELNNLKGRRVYCRVQDWPVGPFPFNGGDFLFEAGPYSIDAERRLFERLDVDWLIVRNSGGSGSWPKLEAARDLGLRVAMIRRPPQPEGARITSVAEALSWVRRRM